METLESYQFFPKLRMKLVEFGSMIIELFVQTVRVDDADARNKFVGYSSIPRNIKIIK